jgi:hypothetical protein
VYRRCAVAFLLLFALTATASVWAKSPTLKITIKGDKLKSIIELTGPGIREFAVWAGAGVKVNDVPQLQGFIVDWPMGVIAELPEGLETYEVAFHVNHQQPDSRYVVKYAYARSGSEGFVYLPGSADENGDSNRFLISRLGFDGNWTMATDEWNSFARPIIERAIGR